MVEETKNVCEKKTIEPSQKSILKEGTCSPPEKSKEEPNTANHSFGKSWPLKDIKEPHVNDVLYGRGGGTNHHPGNKRYRIIVEKRKLDYVKSKRLDKPIIASEIIKGWRAQEPPGRFLKQSESTGLWFDVGDRKAREKCSQALRERAPQIRKLHEEELRKCDTVQQECHSEEEIPRREQRVEFSEHTKYEKKSDPNVLKPSVLMRDHSLGTEYLKYDETLTIQGFSWQNPVDKIDSSTAHQNSQSIRENQLNTRTYPQMVQQPYTRQHSLAANPLTNADIDVNNDNKEFNPQFVGWGPHERYPYTGGFVTGSDHLNRTNSNESPLSKRMIQESSSLYYSWSGSGEADGFPGGNPASLYQHPPSNMQDFQSNYYTYSQHRPPPGAIISFPPHPMNQMGPVSAKERQSSSGSAATLKSTTTRSSWESTMKLKTSKKSPQDNINLVSASSSPVSKESKAEPPLQIERNSSIGVFLKDVLDESGEEEQKKQENNLPKIQDSLEEAPPIINKEIRQTSICSEISGSSLSMEGGTSLDITTVKDLIRPNPAKRTTSNQAENSATKKNTKLMRTKSISTNDDLLENENNQTDDEIQHLSCKMQENTLEIEKPSIMSKEDRKSTIDVISQALIQENNLLKVSSSLEIEKPSIMSKEDRKSTFDVISEDLKSMIDKF